MISLSDRQLDIVAQAAAALPVEKPQHKYLERIAEDFAVRHGLRFSDSDVAAAAQAALAGLTQHTVA